MGHSHYRPLALIAIVVGLTACSESGTGGTQAADGQKQQNQSENAEIQAPAGQYRLDRDHSSLHFQVQHLGLSDYVMRFTKYDVELDLQPQQIAQSSVQVSIDPNSVAADYYSDYTATHPEAEFDNWTTTLARSDKFFNADKHPKITYISTGVEETGPGKLRIDGDLTLLGQTHPVTLNARVTGSTAQHPQAGVGAVAFAATGSFQRSMFGMDYLLSPPLVSDQVTLNFNGEFLAAKQSGQQAQSESSQ